MKFFLYIFGRKFTRSFSLCRAQGCRYSGCVTDSAAGGAYADSTHRLAVGGYASACNEKVVDIFRQQRAIRNLIGEWNEHVVRAVVSGLRMDVYRPYADGYGVFEIFVVDDILADESVDTVKAACLTDTHC